jgi:hypothetical protein
VRLSWCHLTELPDVKSMVKALERFRTRAEPVK